MTSPQLMGARRLRELFAAHDFVPRKRWGQNFVIDPNTIRKVVEVAEVAPTDRVLEIGAGAGSLTIALAAAARSVTALETDERLVPILRETVGPLTNVKIVVADATESALGDFDAGRMVGNLPYNVAANLALRVLEDAPAIERLTVMTQREVGERLAAPAGSQAYGATSVLVAYWGIAKVMARVSRAAFWPAPNVDSVLVRIDRRPPPDVDGARFYEVVKAAFQQRRKNLRNSLTLLAGSAEAAAVAVTSSGLDPRQRAESVDIDGFAALTKTLTDA